MSEKPIATLILQRNLPRVTDRLVEHIKRWNDGVTDIYVIESGSDEDKLSQYYTFWANWPEARDRGLHYCRGFNYGLLELDKTGKRYPYYFMVCGDTLFNDESTLHVLLELMERYKRLGIVSPLSPDWGERELFSDRVDLKCVWLIPHVAWMFRREFLDLIIARDGPSHMNYFYDGTNFRGYDADTELIIKAYLNDYALALTSRVQFREQLDLTDKNAAVMKTEKKKLHQQLMYEEGLAWMKRKYGFDSKLEMRDWARKVYKKFMRRNKDYRKFKI